MHLCNALAVSAVLISSVYAQFSGYQNISTAMRGDTPMYLHYENNTRSIMSHERYESLQQWYFTGSSSGYYFIANRQGGVLSAVGNGQQAHGDDFDPNAISRQAWKIIEVADGWYELESKKYLGSVLDIPESSAAKIPAILDAPRKRPRNKS